MIASNKTLDALAVNQPTTVTQLRAVSGVGPKIIERYGDELIALVCEYKGILPVSEQQEASVKAFMEQKGVTLTDEEFQKLKTLFENN